MSEPWEDEPEGPVRKFMYVNRRAPYGTIYALESLEVVLIAAAFEQDVSLVFMDDGEIIETAPPAAFFANPKNERTKLFLSQILSH